MAFTQRSFTALILLSILAFISNYWVLSLAPGVDFSLSSMVIFLTIYLYGTVWGILVALLANSDTLVGGTYLSIVLIFLLEALFVGLAWQRGARNLLLLDGIFWLIIGLPTYWISLTHFAANEPPQTLFILLKLPINGIFNAAIAGLLVAYLPLERWAGRQATVQSFSLRHILLHLMVVFVLLPALITMAVSSRQRINNVKTEVIKHIDTITANVATNFHLLHRKHLYILQTLRTLYLGREGDTAILEQEATLLQELFPELLTLGIADAKAHLIWSHPLAADATDSLPLLQHLKEVLDTSQYSIFISTIVQNQIPVPVIVYALAIQREQVVFSYLNLENWLKSYISDNFAREVYFTLTTQENLVVNTTRQELMLFTSYTDWLSRIPSTFNLASYSHSVLHPAHTVQEWRDTVFVKQVPLNEEIPLKLFVDMPLRSYVDAFQRSYANRLTITAIITLLSLIFGIVVSNWLVKPLSRLAYLTHNLPNRLEQKDSSLWWPASRITEVDKLTVHFQSMAQSLQARFEEIHSAKTLLEERVRVRTQELQHERALLRSLIDSIPYLIFYKDCEGKYLGCNKAFAAFVGYPEDELIGKTDADLFSVEAKQLLHEQEQQILKEKKPLIKEEWGTYPNGQRVLLDTLKAPFFTAERQVVGLMGISYDITVRKRTEDEIRQSREMLRLVMDSVPQSIFWKNLEGIYLGCNKNFALKVGLTSPYTIVGKMDWELLEQGHVEPTFLETLNRIIAIDEQADYHRIESLCLRDDKVIWLEINKVPLRDNHNKTIGVLCSFEDITEHKQAEEKLRQAAKVLENSTEAIVITDSQTQIVSVNKAFTQITGYTASEAIGKKPADILKSGRQSTEFYREMWEAINEMGYWEGEIWNRRKNGEIYPEWLHITVIKDEMEQKITHFLAIFSDITHRKQTEQRLAYLAEYDELTGLPNRTSFYQRVSRAIVRAQQKNTLTAVMFLDLDRFKYINDTWGHAVGDLLLKSVAKRLKQSLRDNDTIARLGGDDFTVVLENLEVIDGAAQIAQRLLDVMVTPFDLEGHETFITTSIGISLYPNDATDTDTLLKNADVAMYRAKESGKNNYQFFTSEMNALVHKRLQMETQLRHALERNQLILYYQPQIHLASGKIIGAEVLLRWQHPEMGMVPPQDFIPLAEETGLIIQIGEWVLRQTCLQHQKWRTTGMPILRMSVNLSSVQFRQSDLMDSIVKILTETDMDPSLLELELTESILMQDSEKAIGVLHQLKAKGIQLAIDDFGTGYSSLSYLKRFPIDKLKIDQSFISEIPANQDDMAIIKAIIVLARTLNLQVIAEGVETKSQLAFLKSLKCDEVQGYLLGRPVPVDEFVRLFN